MIQITLLYKHKTFFSIQNRMVICQIFVDPWAFEHHRRLLDRLTRKIKNTTMTDLGFFNVNAILLVLVLIKVLTVFKFKAKKK